MLNGGGGRKQILLAVLIIGLVWFAVFLSAYPGFFCYDTIHILNAIDNGTYTNQQPVIHTFLVAHIIKAGMSLLGTLDGGVALYCCLQLVIMLFLVYAILNFLPSIKDSKAFLWIACAYFALNPLLAMFASCTTKDVMFSFFVILFGLLVYRLMSRAFCSSKAEWFGILLLTFIVSIYRNNAVFVVIALLLFLIFKLRKNKGTDLKGILRKISPLILGVLFAFAWNGPFATALGVQKANPIDEMISIPAEQLGRICYFEEEVNLPLFEELGVDPRVLGAQYALSPQSADYTRPVFWEAIHDGKLPVFLNLWLSNCLAHPLISIDAVLYLTEPAWSPFCDTTGYNVPNANYEYDSTETSLFQFLPEEPITADSKIPVLHDLLWKISRFDTLQSIPLLGWLVSIAFYFWLLLISLTSCSIKGNDGGSSFCFLLLMLCCTNFLGPMVLVRYYLPLLFSAPILVGFIISPPVNMERAVSR